MPDKHKLGERPPSEVEKARTRLMIESVLSTLTGRPPGALAAYHGR